MRTLITHFIVLGFFLAGSIRAQGDSFLGISIEDDGRNVLIVEVMPKSPAEKAGLRIGDILLRLDGSRITDMDAFVDKVRAMSSGQSLELQIRRGERQRRIEVVLGRRGGPEAKPRVKREPKVAREPERRPDRGKKLAPLPKQAAKGRGYLGVYLEWGDDGLRVREVISGTAAERAGLRQGDTISRVDGKPVRSLESFVQTIARKGAGQKLPLVLEREGRSMKLSVRLGARPDEIPAMREGERKAREHDAREHEEEARERAAERRAREERAAKKRAGQQRAAKARAARQKAKDARDQAAKGQAKARAAERRARQAARREAARGRAATGRKAPRREAVWLRDYGRARKLAESSGRPLLIDFYADWCRPCKMLDRSFEAAELRQLLANCVLVKVDVDQDERLADEFGVSNIPLVVVMDAAGKKLGSVVGYRPADELSERLAPMLGDRVARAPEKAPSRLKPRPGKKAAKAAKPAKAPRRKAAKKARAPARELQQLQKELRQILDMQRKLQKAIDRLQKQLDRSGR